MEPEEQLDSRTVYEGRILKVRVDKVRLSGGTEIWRDVVDHTESVVIIPIEDSDTILLVRQYRYPVQQTVLEAPAGRLDGSESPKEAAQRELQEEVGYLSGRLELLGSFWMSPGYCTEFMHAFVARDLEPNSLEPDDDENIVVERFSAAEVIEMIYLGEIQDAKTIAAVMLALGTTS